MFKEEEKYLEYTLDKIDEELKKANVELKELCKKGTTLSFEDRKRGEHFNINAMADTVGHKIGVLNRAISKPYFGRIDFSFSDNLNEVKKIYIGKTGIISNSNSVVTDWRAPISSLYYDSNIGNVEYQCPQGTIRGIMSLKRQINIKDSKLIDAVDASLVTGDELLKPYLSQNADNKMKIIISSIQKEQNKIIRKSPSTNIIVQGVAGSGKTSVALHRIAYLIYELSNKIHPEQFLVLGPNKYFLDYVSSILPDLEISPVNQETYFELVKEYIGRSCKVSLKEENIINVNDLEYRKIQALKSSLEFKKLVDDFMSVYLEKYAVIKDFVIDGEVVFDKEKVKSFLFMLDNKIPNYNKAYQMLSVRLKDNLNDIYNNLNRKYKEVYTKMAFDDPERKKIVAKSTALYNELKVNGKKIVKKYIKEIDNNVINIYMMFIMNLTTENTGLDEKTLLLLKKETLLDLKKKKMGFEDLPALVYINYLITKKKLDYKYIIIDEAQDYGEFHFDVLKTINPDSNFAIYGDLAQSIYSYKSVESWEKLNTNVFDGKFELLDLSKSYRTTKEITENANVILDYMGLDAAVPVIRNGNNVYYAEEADNLDYKISKIKELQERKYETIAIICKTDKEAKKLNSDLIKRGIDAKYISNKDSLYDGNILTLTSLSAKGLEFDSVIINDASEGVYSSLSDTDMHLLYVASTRALHELIILYKDNIVEVFRGAIENKPQDGKEGKKIFCKK